MIDAGRETTSGPTLDVGEEVIGIRELLAVLWAQRWVVLFVVIGFMAAAVAYLNVANYRYTAELKITPAQSSGGGSAGGAGLASLASLAGVSLGKESSVTPFQLYIEGVKSRAVAEAMARQPEIMKVVFQGEWAESERRFVNRPGAASQISRAVKNALGIPVYPWQAPDAARLQQYIQNNVNIIESPKSPVVTLTFSHPDPQFAELFLASLNRNLDEQLRRKALIRTGRYISYLSEQLRRVTIAEHRLALTNSLSEQEKFRMMASSGLAYAADPFGEPTSSIIPTSPKPATTLVLSAFLGLAVGTLVAFGRWYLAKQR